ncbi:MAG: LysR substrate-binding domain-containing protein [Traorella sp.]
MEIQVLKEFIHVAEVGNYLDASSDLFISQSTLSKHIMALEQELGFKLFYRTTRKIEITNMGQEYLKYAREIVRIYDESMEAMKYLNASSTNSFQLGIIPSVDPNELGSPLILFNNRFKQYSVSTHEGDTSELIQLLKEEKISMGFMYETSEIENDDSFVKINFLEDYLVAVIPHTNPLSANKEVTLEMLKNETLMLLSTHTYLISKTKQIFNEKGYEPNISFTPKRILSSFDLRNENTIAIFLSRDAYFVNSPSNAICKIVPAIKNKLSLVYLKKHKLLPVEKEFINCVIEISNKIKK